VELRRISDGSKASLIGIEEKGKRKGKGSGKGKSLKRQGP